MDIKDFLKEKGQTKASISKRIGISRQNFNTLLKNPTERTIERLAQAIGCEAWELLAPQDVRQRIHHSQTCTCPKCGTLLKLSLTVAEDDR